MSECGCQSMDVSVLEARQRKVLSRVMVINLAAFAMMVFAAFATHSTALLSGTLDNLGDALAYAVSLAVIGLGARMKARAAMLKSVLIFAAGLFVLAQLIGRSMDPQTPLAVGMAVAAAINLVANGVCLAMLTPLRGDDVNMASVWLCSRNDVAEGIAVLVTAAMVYVTASPIPDLFVAAVLLWLFFGSAYRISQEAMHELRAMDA
jgi:Co/Zn/Cd efflux system component